MKIKKFRVWDNFLKRFYHFELNNVTFSEKSINQYSCNVQQFIGIFDSCLKEIYEGDVVKYFDYYGEQIGEVMYSADSCAYYIDHYPIMNLKIDSLEIVGNMLEDYYYDDNGNLVKYENANT